jgi:hypothetical protein
MKIDPAKILRRIDETLRQERESISVVRGYIGEDHPAVVELLDALMRHPSKPCPACRGTGRV